MALGLLKLILGVYGWRQPCWLGFGPTARLSFILQMSVSTGDRVLCHVGGWAEGGQTHDFIVGLLFSWGAGVEKLTWGALWLGPGSRWVVKVVLRWLALRRGGQGWPG